MISSRTNSSRPKVKQQPHQITTTVTRKKSKPQSEPLPFSKPRRRGERTWAEYALFNIIRISIIASICTVTFLMYRRLMETGADSIILNEPVIYVNSSTVMGGVFEEHNDAVPMIPDESGSTSGEKSATGLENFDKSNPNLNFKITPLYSVLSEPGEETQVSKIETKPDATTIKKKDTTPTKKKDDSKKKENKHEVATKNNGKKKKRRQKEPPDITVEPDYGLEEHIELMPIREGKTGIKRDRRVIFPGFEYKPLRSRRSKAPPSNVVGFPREYVSVRAELEKLPLFEYFESLGSKLPTLEDTMYYLYNLDQCGGKPIFLSMASVGDDLYWQLIENFVYTMAKFKTAECSLVICVSDPNCMRLCHESSFPCFDFKSNVYPLPSVMEQIGEVKLFHVPKALAMGVDVFMLDLDVGFLYDPLIMVDAFMATPKVDIFVQEDLIFLMNRTTAGWRTWFTQPLPNIGLFLCRGNNKTGMNTWAR